DILVNGAQPAENGIILNDDVPAERRIVGHDHMVADLAVMRDVDADHEEAVVADARDHAAALGPGVHRHIFADRVVAPDHQLGLLAPILEILWFKTDRGERKHPAAVPDRRLAVDYHMRAEDHPCAEGDLSADN